MATTIIGNGIPYKIIYPEEKSASDFHKIKVDGGSIILDKAADHDEYAHLYLKGNLQNHEAYFKVENNSNVELLRVDNSGKLHATSGLVAPEITTLTNSVTNNTSTLTTIAPKVTANETAVASHTTLIGTNTTSIGNNTSAIGLNTTDRTNATHLATNDTLVKRLNSGDGTQFTTLTTNLINVGQAAAAYGDSSYQWIAQDNNGQNIAGSFARLGTNISEMGDLSSAGDGLELSGLPTAGQTKYNKIELFPASSAPSIQLQCSKDASVPWVRLNGELGFAWVELDLFGVSQAVTNTSQSNISPGNNLTGVLARGLCIYNLTLTGNWSANNPELIIVLTDRVKDHLIRSVEVSLEGNVSSTVYVDRYSKTIKSPASNSELRIVLKHELLGGETNIPSGTVIKLAILNNRIIL